MDLVPAAKTALLSAGIDAHDGDPETTPAGRYVALYGDSGLAIPHRRQPRPHWQSSGLLVVCVARTPAGLRALVREVRAALTGVRLDESFGLLNETTPGPELSGGPEGDRRLSMTVTYSCQTPV